MKFDYCKDKYSELGLIVRHGNIGNVVFFWDENTEAASYNLEIYRIDWQYENEGFFTEVELTEREVTIYGYNERSVGIDKYLPTKMPAIIKNQFAVMKEWQADVCPTRSEVNFHDFDKAKPICTINIERNKFYHSINDLPCGDYIVCFKIENRSGEIFAESTPYCFHIDDAEKLANDRANGIARAVSPHSSSCW